MVGESPEADIFGGGDSGDLSIDVVFDLLADRRRRHVLACLLDGDRAIALSDLAEDVAVREHDRPRIEIPKERAQAIRTSLYHVHVPKLADAGVIEYDRDRNLVRASDTAVRVEHALSRTESATTIVDPV